jgi:hypothetical protein
MEDVEEFRGTKESLACWTVFLFSLFSVMTVHPSRINCSRRDITWRNQYIVLTWWIEFLVIVVPLQSVLKPQSISNVVDASLSSMITLMCQWCWLGLVCVYSCEGHGFLFPVPMILFDHHSVIIICVMVLHCSGFNNQSYDFFYFSPSISSILLKMAHMWFWDHRWIHSSYFGQQSWYYLIQVDC